MNIRNLMTKNERLLQFIRFVAVGVGATAIHYAIYYFLQKINIQYNIAYTLGYAISFIFNFIASNYFTFKTKPSANKGIKFAMAHICNYLLQMLILNLLVYAGVPKAIAPIFVFMVSIPVNFLMVRFALTKSEGEGLLVKVRTKWAHFLTGAAIGCIAFILVYGVKVLDFTNVGWLLSAGDLTQHYIGWAFFRDSSWTFPLGMMKNYGYPFGVAITYTDSIPLFAIPFKLLSPILPEPFQYFGLWGLLVFILQGGISAIIFKKYIKSLPITALASTFIIFSPIMIRKMFNHTALSAHWIILLALAIWVYKENFYTLKKKVITWTIINILAVLIHPYFVPMTLVVMAGFLLDDMIHNKKFIDAILTVLSSLIGVVITFWIIGGFTGESLQAEGLGKYSMNLNALINPNGWSRFFVRDLPYVTSGQYEGFQYLGFGLLFMIPICVYMFITSENFTLRFKRENLLPNLKKFCPVIFVVVALFFLSVSNIISINDRIIFRYSFPPFIEGILGIFRSTGRLFWPVTYMIAISIIVYIYKRSRNIRGITILLSVLLCFHVVDMSDILEKRRNDFNQYITFKTTLKSPIWNDLGKNFKNMVILPAYLSSYSYFSKLVTDYNMTLNTGSYARGPYKQIAQYAAATVGNLKQGKADKNTVYIIQHFNILTDVMINAPKDLYKAVKADGYFILYVSSEFNLPNYEDIEVFDSSNFEKLTFDNYLDELNNLNDNEAVFMAVKGDNFTNLTESELNKLRSLGLNENIQNINGDSYAAVVVPADKSFNVESMESSSAEISYKIGDILGSSTLKSNLDIRSGAKKYGNFTHILMDGVQHSMNRNGINIVVYDIEKDEVLQIASFDRKNSDSGEIMRWKK